MGACCQTNQPLEKYDTIANMKLEQWYIGNDFFDGFTFNRNIQLDENNSFQKFLRQGWKGKDLHTSPPPRNCIASFNTKNHADLNYSIQKGVPNYLIREVVLKLVTFDDDLARNNYGEILECLEPLPDFVNLPATLEPFFGRRDLNNVFLTSIGIVSCKRILHTIKMTMTEIKVCILLPRVTQLMLWFLKEHEVFQVIQVLLNESKGTQMCEKYSLHFPFGLEKFKEIARIICKHLEQEDNKKLRIVIKDVMYNFLVGYISPSFYSIVLMYFLADGMGGFIRFVVSLFKLCWPGINPCFSSECSREELIFKVREICKNTSDIASIMKNAYKVVLDIPDNNSVSSISSGEDLTLYTPIFDGASKIIENPEEIQALCSYIPQKYLKHNISLRFSIHKTGFESQKFVDAFTGIIGPSILLIETYKKKVVGIFLDKSIEDMEDIEDSDSCLFVLRPDFKVFNHIKGEKFRVSVDLKNGFIVSDSNKDMCLMVGAGLSNAFTAESKTFCSPKLAKSEEFLIYDLELFELA
ncbi:hypothetical protein SteCoe_25915 [Stentor coeruleus]|uniref:TLDc domain-containing protein n=1 Tax=Stentor coeruleus TaxID=5963 RepID=A0A1R2BE32_9CILI|nr:hypothetical protein SteCoe_25915 [Stentor coeruleus]